MDGTSTSIKLINEIEFFSSMSYLIKSMIFSFGSFLNMPNLINMKKKRETFLSIINIEFNVDAKL